MNQVTIKISKVFLPFSIKRKVPSSWDEVSEATYCRMSEALLTNNRTLKFLILARIQPYIWKLIDPLVRFELLNLVDFTDTLPNRFFTECIGNSFAPNHSLSNLSIGQYAMADFYFLKLISTSLQIGDLDKLVATLYLPKGSKYTPEQSEYTQFLNKVPITTKLGIMLSYKSARDHMIKQFPHVFDFSQDPDIIEIGPQSSAPDVLHIFPLINELSKTGQYGRYQEVFNTEMSTIFFNRELDLKKPPRK